MVWKSAMKNNVIIIIGPTASGKSSMAIQLAKELDGEVISADSSQVYTGLDIGSAKITQEEMQGVVHHLIDIKQPDEEFNVVEFKILALQKIEYILKRNKFPIVCGGTGLYIRALIDDYDFDNAPPKSVEIREHLDQLKNKYGKSYLYEMLCNLDSKKSKKINPNDEVRTIRALEIALSKNQSTYKSIKNDYKYFVYVLNKDRNELYQNINDRVDMMVENGLFEEVKQLMDKGITTENSCFKSIGYKEIYNYYKQNLDKQEVINLIKQKSRNYAKRQLTFFRSIKDAVWINDKQNKLEKILNDYNNRTN